MRAAGGYDLTTCWFGAGDSYRRGTRHRNAEIARRHEDMPMIEHNAFWSINAGPLSGLQVTAGERESERETGGYDLTTCCFGASFETRDRNSEIARRHEDMSMVGHNTFLSINAGPLSGLQVTAGGEGSSALLPGWRNNNTEKQTNRKEKNTNRKIEK